MMMDVIEENNYTSNELSAVETGRIIVAARELEQLLREAGAPESAVGLHQATEAMAHKLPEELQKKLHYIATVRNQAAHGNGTLREAINLNEFEAGAYEVKQALQQLSGKGGRKRNKKNFQISPVTENMSDPIAGDLQKFYRILGIFGCLPVANLVYFAVLIFQGLYAARQAFLLLIAYVDNRFSI